MEYRFFSFHDFKHDGGGTIRMYGILNALASKGYKVVFLSNATDFSKFHPAIEHIFIGQEIGTLHKRVLQSFAAILPSTFILLLYSKLFKKIKTGLNKASVDENSTVYFFEYLDNTIGYLLKRRGVINTYINDIHGIATIEFKYQYDQAKNLGSKFKNYLKYKFADKLDKKVFELGDGFIYASNAMKEYYESVYNISKKKSYIIPNLLGSTMEQKKVDNNLQVKLKNEFDISKTDFVFFFAGGYKATAGVQDLIAAFNTFDKKFKNGRLILIGTGPSKRECLELIVNKGIEEKVIVIDKVPYENLPTYQSLANVLVCPDRQNPYSELIVHLKYFDSLASGKLVINGSFKSVKEINPENKLSLSFEPSNTENLYKVMEKAYLENEGLKYFYKDTQQYTLENLTYESCINRLIH